MSTEPTTVPLQFAAPPSWGAKHRNRRELCRQLHGDGEREEIRQVIQKLWKASGAPQRHQDPARSLVDGRVDGNRPPASPWLDQLLEISEEIGSGFIVVLHGARGTGKTQLAVNLIREACIEQRPARYTTAMSLFFALRATYKPDEGRTEAAVVRDYVEPQLLVVDEIHERGESSWEDRTLGHILNERYARCLDTVLVTNETAKAAAESLGASITDRVRECGWLVSCDWPSFRGAA